jgi:hypothetical protein
MTSDSQWHQSNVQSFWGEIASSNHLLQIYENETVFLNSIEGFAGSGFIAGDCVVIIATESHIKSLNERLNRQGFNIAKLIKEKRYVTVDASETLAEFMTGEEINEKKFIKTINRLLKRCDKKRKVRAFGEMVAILWENGNNRGTFKLERIWNDYMKEKELCLFCAYPKSAFTKHTKVFQHICDSHHKLISGVPGSTTEISYFENIIPEVTPAESPGLRML